jgi:hypothetical protein
MRARAYRLSGGIRHPLRNGFTAYAELSPVIGLVCHRRRRSYLRQLERQRRGVRTTRFCRTLKRRSSCAPAWRTDTLASTTSRPAFVTTRDRPSCRNGTAAFGH